ncbi:MAG: zinc ribbon domain-containing protein [Methanobacteriaceae archaeon]|nr:zinc ribbon domain-containing protein [Methanobacteriaceae archaeon]
MVSNEEIRRMLDQKRRGVKPKVEPRRGRYREIEDKTQCPSCGTENPSTAKFCIRCGSALSKKEEGSTVCLSCGSENPEQAKFCVKCGENLHKAVSPETTPSMETEEKTEEKTVKILPEDIKTSSETSKDYKICPSCQNKNPVGAKFCVVCGHTFKEETKPSEKPESLPEETIEKPEIIQEETPEKPEEDVHEADLPQLEEFEASKKEPEVLAPDEGEISPGEEPLESQEESEDVLKEESTEDITKPGDIDPVERIKKAKELLDMGAITQEDFDRIKSKYLDEI